MSGRTLVLDAVLDPGLAEVVCTPGTSGRRPAARFRMSGVPRVESLLVGRPVASVPGLVERLCGICPSSHQLAGVAALEAVLGIPRHRLPRAAVTVRRLLHHGAVLEAHAHRLPREDGDVRGRLMAVARCAQRAAGGPGHFPQCAVPGGVRSVPTAEVLDELAAGLADVLPGLVPLVDRVLDDEAGSVPAGLPRWTGVDLALVDRDGVVDLLGTRARAVDATGEEVAFLTPESWADLVVEEAPGSVAPHAHLAALGPDGGRFRVGPAAQLRVGPLATARADRARDHWLLGPRTAAAARAVMALHCAERLVALIGDRTAYEGPLVVESPSVTGAPTVRTGTGWMDGQRGLLAHTYTSDADGRLAAARILTPTAHNEPWLADLLEQVLADADVRPTAPVATTGRLRDRLEAAIREADPCLPCTAMPPGSMSVTLRPDDPEV